MIIYKTTACGLTELTPKILDAIDKTKYINIKSIKNVLKEIDNNKIKIKQQSTKEVNYDRV